jgi:hypothetical protein
MVRSVIKVVHAEPLAAVDNGFNLFPDLLVMPDSWIEPFPQGLGNNVPNFSLRRWPAALASKRTRDSEKDEAEVFRGVIADRDLFRLADVAVAL